MAEGNVQERKKEIMKDIIERLHEGASLEGAKDRFEREIGGGITWEPWRSLRKSAASRR